MKLLVNVYIPAISENNDVLIPANLRVKNVVSLIASTVEELSNHLYAVSGGECLCSVEKGILLRYNATLEDYGICNGSHLILM